MMGDPPGIIASFGYAVQIAGAALAGFFLEAVRMPCATAISSRFVETVPRSLQTG
jgi:hypothetical protein